LSSEITEKNKSNIAGKKRSGRCEDKGKTKSVDFGFIAGERSKKIGWYIDGGASKP